jgi:hypothetical protein
MFSKISIKNIKVILAYLLISMSLYMTVYTNVKQIEDNDGENTLNVYSDDAAHSDSSLDMIEDVIVDDVVVDIDSSQETSSDVEMEIFLTQKELDLINVVVQAEANNQDETGKRLVIDVIFNRLNHEKFPNTIKKVIYSKGAFSVVPHAIKKYKPLPEIEKLIIEEYARRTDGEVLYFKSGSYHNFGTPLFKHQDHYFSKN